MSDAELIERIESLAAEEFARWPARDDERRSDERWTAGAEWASFRDQLERLRGRAAG